MEASTEVEDELATQVVPSINLKTQLTAAYTIGRSGDSSSKTTAAGNY
jgi:hypothetical protein